MVRKAGAPRKPGRVIEIDARGRPRRGWRYWLTKTFKITVAMAGLVTFWRNWGWKLLVSIIALAGTVGAATIDI